MSQHPLANRTLVVSGGSRGIGLAIAQAIVQVHCGKVSAASTPGEGARFTVTLPIAEGAIVPELPPVGTYIEQAERISLR